MIKQLIFSVNYDINFLCCYAYAFCLRTNKDSSVGEFDESIIIWFRFI